MKKNKLIIYCFLFTVFTFIYSCGHKDVESTGSEIIAVRTSINALTDPLLIKRLKKDSTLTVYSDTAFRLIDHEIFLPNIDVFTRHFCSSTPKNECLFDTLRIPHKAQSDLLHLYAIENAWRLFLAMCWPIDSTLTQLEGDCWSKKNDYITMWDCWPTQHYIFEQQGVFEEWDPVKSYMDLNTKKGLNASKFHNYSNLTNDLKTLSDNRPMDPNINNWLDSRAKKLKLEMCLKIHDIQDSLYDQSRKKTRYEVAYNPKMYHYITAPKRSLHRKSGVGDYFENVYHLPDDVYLAAKVTQNNRRLRDFKALNPESICFPIGCNVDTTKIIFNHNLVEDSILLNGMYSYKYRHIHIDKNIGSIVIKTSWRKLGKDDDLNKYHLRINKTNRDTLGLVGIHIGRKTFDTPTWMWITFEHVDNCPDINDLKNRESIKNNKYSYFDPNNMIDSIINKPGHNPAQIVREKPIDSKVMNVNEAFHKIIKNTNAKSVWLNYQLVGVQWSIHNDVFFPYECSDARNKSKKWLEFNVRPAILANTTMEPYIQKSSSCASCHLRKSRLFTNDTIHGFKGHYQRSLNYDFVISATKVKRP